MPFQTLWQDVRFGLRTVARQPGFALTVALTFALGIGATTAIFTVVDGVLLRPLPFADPGRLVSIQEDYGRGPNVFVASPEVVEWQRHSGSARVAAYFDGAVNLWGGQQSERVQCGMVTQGLFPLLGVNPAIGRYFLPEEDRPGGPAAVILSHRTWMGRFGGTASVLGQSLVLDGKSYTVVGVMPEGFQVPGEFPTPQELWLPFQLEEGRARLKMAFAVARLGNGVSIDSARAELDTLFQALRRGRKTTGRVVLVEWQRQVGGRVRSTLLIFMGSVGLVLLIACVNVANLLLSRGSAREKEMAVRRALGAGTGRLVRQLLTESILLSVAGGILGMGLAALAKSLLLAFLANTLPTVPAIPLDWRVLGFNLGLAVVCGIAFGMAPALEAARVSVNERLKDSGRGSGGPSRGYLRDGLVVAEVALSMALLIGGGLLFHSFLRLRGMGSQTPAGRIVTMQLQLKGSRYGTAPAQAAMFRNVVEAIAGVPGVEAAAATTWFGAATTEMESAKGAEVQAAWSVISPDYFRLMGIPLLRGRTFTGSDTHDAPEVAVVSQTFARRYCPGGDCIGQRLGSLFRKDGWATIVGVAADRRIELGHDPGPTLYTAYQQRGEGNIAGEYSMILMARTPADPMWAATPIRSRVAELDRTQALTRIETLEQAMAREIAPQRVNTMLLVWFAALALLLGSAGIYGVMSHAVNRRTHEIGIRMALGADRGRISGMVIARGLRLVVAGEVIGAAAALGFNRWIAGMLFQVGTTDPATYLSVAALWTAVGLAACYLPARRAVRIDPLQALRSE